jgi:hypothetical protein
VIMLGVCLCAGANVSHNALHAYAAGQDNWRNYWCTAPQLPSGTWRKAPGEVVKTAKIKAHQATPETVEVASDFYADLTQSQIDRVNMIQQKAASKLAPALRKEQLSLVCVDGLDGLVVVLVPILLLMFSFLDRAS